MAEGLEQAAGVSEGEILAGKYRVDKVLGVGGMGVVVLARHIELDERVAIKFLLPVMLTDTNAVVRFSREAKAAVRIKSEHVARVFDVGRLENGAPYMVMEFLEGSDLSAWLAQHGALPIAQAVDFVVQACVAVADAHALGIIHRDLKPANLFCVRRTDGQLSIKVLDFGISKLTEPGSGMSFTQTSAMMGSPLYMSPEQFRSAKSVDARTDIWALGTILFELVTGQPPFSADSVPELAIKIVTESPPSATLVRRDVPPELARVVAKCLEKEPARRYRDVAELAVALSPFAPPAARPLVDRVIGILSKPGAGELSSQSSRQIASHVEGKTAPATHWTAPETPRRRGVSLTLALAGALAVAAFGGISWWRTQNASPTSSAVPAATVGEAPPSTTVPPLAAPAVPSTGPVATTDTKPPPTAPSTSASASAAQPEASAVTTSRKNPVATPPPRTKRPAPVTTTKTATAAPTPSPPAAARVNCDPPFFFDSKGNRVFKPECL